MLPEQMTRSSKLNLYVEFHLFILLFCSLITFFLQEILLKIKKLLVEDEKHIRFQEWKTEEVKLFEILFVRCSLFDTRYILNLIDVFRRSKS